MKEQQESNFIPTQFKDEDEWVDYYVRSHSLENGIKYKESYLPYMIVDRLLAKYTLLEIGCGTAGYLKLLPNLGHFTGIDWSKKMIDAAKKINPQHEFTAITFDKYHTEKKFDVVIDFVTGMYDPPAQKNIDKIFSLLNKNGIAVISVRSHRVSLKEKIGDIIKRRKSLKISEPKMLKICAKFKHLFLISKKSGTVDIEVYFLQKL